MRRLFSALLAAGALLAFSGPANADPVNHSNFYVLTTEDCGFSIQLALAPHYTSDLNPSVAQRIRRGLDCGKPTDVEAGAVPID